MQQQGRSVLLSGPNGSGRSHLLTAASEHLRALGIAPFALDCAARSAAQRMTEADRDEVLVLDGLEQADPELLYALARWLECGGTCIGAVDPGNEESAFTRVLRGLDQSGEVRNALEAVEVIELERLPDELIERFLHERSCAPVDALTMHAIVTLAEGRIRWATSLLGLAQAGLVIRFPRPSISRVSLGRPRFPALRSVARAIGALSPETAAAAVVLSEAGSIDRAGAEDLVGSGPVDLLLRRGALSRGSLPDLFHVSPFVAAAVSDQAPAELVEEYQGVLVNRLLGKAAFGLPLSEAEAYFCTRSAKRSRSTEPLQSAEAVRRTVFHRVLADLADFGDDEFARTLILRANELDPPPCSLHRATVLSTLVGPEAGLAELDRMPEADDPAQRLAALHLRMLLRQRAAHAFSGAADDVHGERTHGSPESSEAPESDAETVLRLWNTASPIGDEIPRLRSISARSDEPYMRLLSDALATLDEAWRGRAGEQSWLASGAPLPKTSARVADALRHLSGTVLLAHALTVLVSGEYASRRNELHDAVERSSPRAYHRRWMRHFSAAATALACGEMQRAEIEWAQVREHAPRFVPLRLEQCLESIHAELRATIESAPSPATSTENGAMIGRLIRYVAGKHVTLSQQRAIDPHDPKTLPVLRLGAAHLTAVENENPVELLRIAERLRRLELWAPAAFALTKAREIFLGRRMVSGVKQSSDSLALLEQRLQRQALWYRPGQLPTSDYIRLTPRERVTASLAAEGLSNKQIAARLHCSVRTVESHLAQARAKLGAATRRDLVSLAVLQPDAGDIGLQNRQEPPSRPASQKRASRLVMNGNTPSAAGSN